jgi:hypothetical protein
MYFLHTYQPIFNLSINNLYDMKIFKIFKPSWNGLDTSILNYLCNLSILEIDKWTQHYKTWVSWIHLQAVNINYYIEGKDIK